MVTRYRAKFAVPEIPGAVVKGERRRAIVFYGLFAIFAGEATTLRCHFNGNKNEWSVRWIRPGFDQRTIHALAARGFTVAE